MNPTSLQDFVHMGGYGLYVWGSYTVTLALMLVEALAVRQRTRRALAASQAECEAQVRR
jgi:heme exporter protein D